MGNAAGLVQQQHLLVNERMRNIFQSPLRDVLVRLQIFSFQRLLCLAGVFLFVQKVMIQILGERHIFGILSILIIDVDRVGNALRSPTYLGQLETP